jgi:hypothetical protein
MIFSFHEHDHNSYKASYCIMAVTLQFTIVCIKWYNTFLVKHWAYRIRQLSGLITAVVLYTYMSFGKCMHPIFQKLDYHYVFKYLDWIHENGTADLIPT